MAIDLFLGIRPDQTGTRLKRNGYRDWYCPENIRSAYVLANCQDGIQQFVDNSSRFWSEYYRPLLFTSLGKHFAYLMNTTLKLPGKTLKDINQSPFQPHNQPSPSRHIKLRTEVGKSKNLLGTEHGTGSPAHTANNENTMQQWLDPHISEEEEEEYQRYIDQCQGIYDDSEAGPDPQDIIVYKYAVDLASGQIEEELEEGLDEISLTFIQRPLILSADGWSTNWNYERWVNNVGSKFALV